MPDSGAGWKIVGSCSRPPLLVQWMVGPAEGVRLMGTQDPGQQPGA